MRSLDAEAPPLDLGVLVGDIEFLLQSMQAEFLEKEPPSAASPAPPKGYYNPFKQSPPSKGFYNPFKRGSSSRTQNEGYLQNLQGSANRISSFASALSDRKKAKLGGDTCSTPSRKTDDPTTRTGTYVQVTS